MIQQALDPVLPSPRAQAAGLDVIVHEETTGIAPAWKVLQADNHASLHNTQAWCDAWLATNPEKALFVEGRMDGSTVFLLPLSISRRRGSLVARFIASDHNNLSTGLFDPTVDLPPAALRDGLVKALKGRADLISLERMPLKWRDRISPLAYLPNSVNQNRAFQVPLFASFEETLKQVNAKRRRKKFRLQQRRLEEAGGYRVIEPESAAEKHALLDEFFRQKAERFRTQGIPDVFADAPVRAFFHALLDTPADGPDYLLRLNGLQLLAGDQPVLAITGTSRKGDHIICQFGSIREDLLPEASPGEFLFWHVIEAACRDGAAIFDFGIGDQTYKRSWCTVETTQYDVLLPVSLKGHVAAATHRALNRLKAAIKGNPALYGALQRLRRRAAGQPGTPAVSDSSPETD